MSSRTWERGLSSFPVLAAKVRHAAGKRRAWHGDDDCDDPNAKHRIARQLPLVGCVMAFCVLTALFASARLSTARPYALADEHTLRVEPRREVSICRVFRYQDHFGTKSLYNAPSHTEPLASSAKLVHLSLLARHGTRYPTKKNCARLAQLFDTLQHSRSVHSPYWLGNIDNPYRPEVAGELTELGKVEMHMLGRRLWALYGEGAGMNVTRVRTTFKDRAVESARQFSLAWFGGGDAGRALSQRIETHDEVPRDTVLRFFECAPYNEYRDRLKHAREREVSHLGALALRLTHRLALRRALEPAMARLVLHTCMYDVARGVGERSEFCMLLSPGDVLGVESNETDAESFAAAHARYSWVAMPLLDDVLRSLRACASPSLSSSPPSSSSGVSSASDGAACVQANLCFAHAETLVPFALLLGVSGSVDEEWQCRSWIAATCPMAANLVIELYRRESSPPFLVKLRLNERYVTRIDSCGGRDHCTLEELEALSSDLHRRFDWDSVCKGVYKAPKDDDMLDAIRVGDIHFLVSPPVQLGWLFGGKRSLEF